MVELVTGVAGLGARDHVGVDVDAGIGEAVEMLGEDCREAALGTADVEHAHALAQQWIDEEPF